MITIQHHLNMYVISNSIIIVCISKMYDYHTTSFEHVRNIELYDNHAALFEHVCDIKLYNYCVYVMSNCIIIVDVIICVLFIVIHNLNMYVIMLCDTYEDTNFTFSYDKLRV